MSVEAVVSIVLGVVSAVLAAYAIWLSAVFYRAGNEAQERVRDIANRLEASIDVLNSRLQGLQDQTFTLVRETVEDMRGALWPSQGVGPNHDIDRKLNLQNQILDLRKELLDEISRLARFDQRSSSDLERMIDEILRRSAKVALSAGEDRAREAIRGQLAESASRGGMEAGELMTAVGNELPFGLVIRTMYDMREAGELSWRDTDLGPNSVLSLVMNRRGGR